MKKDRQKIELSAEDREVIRKQTKRLIIMGIVLAVLIAAYFILSYVIAKMDAAKAEKEETAETKVFLTTDTDSISAFTYTYQGGEYSFIKEGENWVYTGDKSLDMDEDIINGMIKNLSSSLSKRSVLVKANDSSSVMPRLTSVCLILSTKFCFALCLPWTMRPKGVVLAMLSNP